MSEHLKRAYALKDKADATALYADWASDYDQSFSVAHGYIAPREVARIWQEIGSSGPALDIGAGTGAIAEHLPDTFIDAFDLSPEMLDVAGRKGLYRKRVVGDLLSPLPFHDDSYAGILSSGTFTHGHVGPRCLPELIRVCRVGGHLVCGTNADAFDRAGFGSALAKLVADGILAPVRFHDIPLYDGSVDHAHVADRGLVLLAEVLEP